MLNRLFKRPHTPIISDEARELADMIGATISQWHFDEYYAWYGAENSNSASIKIWIANEDYALRVEKPRVDKKMFSDDERKMLWNIFRKSTHKALLETVRAVLNPKSE